MTSFAYHLEIRAADGRCASIWAIAPSAVDAEALMSAYREAAGYHPREVTHDVGPLALDLKDAVRAGIDLRPGSSGLYCLLKTAA